MNALTNFYNLIVKIGNSLQPVFLLILRLFGGYAFYQVGLGKLENISNVTSYFETLNIPFPEFNAYFVGGVECVGGILLLLGLGARLASLFLVILTLTAYLTANMDEVMQLFQNPVLVTMQDPFLYFLTAVIILIFGPGLFSLDALLKRRINRDGQ